MKKALLLIVGLCILAAPAIFAQSYSSTIPPWTINWSDNFEYGDDYQGKVTQNAFLGGHQIKAGEEYTIKIKFKLSRDMEQPMSVALVDTTEKAKWWTELSNYAEVGTTALKANQEYSFTFELKTIAGATSTGAQANALIFATKGQGKPGTKGSGVKKPFKMEVLEFSVTRK